MDIGAGVLAGLALAVGGAALLTWAWIAVARRWGMQDEPGHRRLHAQRTARGGGTALVLAWCGAVAVALTGMTVGSGPEIAKLLLGAGLFTACGLWDDVAPMRPALKFALQLLIAVVLFLPAWSGPHAALAPLFVVGLVGFVNVWNFMDGSDGMIAWQSLLVALALASWPGQDAGLGIAALMLAAACAGFLPFNFPRARVFLGDAGSHGLGAALYLLLLLTWAEGAIQAWQALLLCTPMLLDSALTLAHRICAGRPFWRAHREHLYQYAVRKGHSHARVALAYAAATALAWLLARLPAGNHAPAAGVSLLASAWAAGAVAYLGLRRRWLGRRMQTGGRR